MQNRWAQIKAILTKYHAPGQISTWIASLCPAEEGGGLVLYAQTAFAASHIRTWYGAQIADAVREVCGPECPVRVEVNSSNGAEGGVRLAGRQGDESATADLAHVDPISQPGSLPVRPTQAAPVALKVSLSATDRTDERPVCILPSPRPLPPVQLALPVTEALQSNNTESHCLWRYNFEDFVVGPSNELAHAASKCMCGNSVNADVLFLSSPPGLGKTHLLHAVGRSISAACNKRSPNVAYLTAEEFASYFYLSLKGQDTDRFKAKYRNLDLLLLEDVHFLQGKEKMQAELLATVKALRDRGARIVFSSSFAPRELKQMDDQLMSRLSAGLLSCIERPDEETRRRILRSKASLHQVFVPEDVEDILARYIHVDVRQIESCLHTLILKAKLLNTRMTPQMAWEIVAQYAEHMPVLDMDAIIGQVCRFFSLSREQLLSPSRKQDLVTARNTAYFLARKHTDLSLEAIGRRFNRRHSTVLKGLTNVERAMSLQSPAGRQIANVLGIMERTGNIASPILHTH